MMANFRTCDSDTLYVLHNTKKIVNRIRIYFLKQKVCGLLLIIIGVLCPIVFDKDATVSTIVIPIGLYLLFVNKHVMSFRM